jgi:kinesin family protein 6/9
MYWVCVLLPAQVHEENKELLRVKYEKAKALGAAVNDSKTRINELKVGREQE